MAEILKGKPVADAICEKVKAQVDVLKARGVAPTLAILRVGENPDDLAYERGAIKRCESVGIEVKVCALREDAGAETFYKTLNELNEDETVHGILMMRPLPKHIDEEKARAMLRPEKDVDGCTDGSLAAVFTDKICDGANAGAPAKIDQANAGAPAGNGFAPCTAQAVLEILDYYGIDPKGKRVTIIGRSLVIGKPVAMMLMRRQATPTICHHFTPNLCEIAQSADILITSAGHPEIFGAEMVRGGAGSLDQANAGGQVVIDVGISWSEEKQKICGDMKFEEVEPIVGAITPVPGGIGTVTTSVLAKHVVEAAERI